MDKQIVTITLAVIGAFSSLIIGWFLSMVIIKFIEDTFHTAKRWYKYKHRFDKSPTAKCYCRDCIYYRSFDGYCHRTNFHYPDNGFCSSAIPSKNENQSLEE